MKPALKLMRMRSLYQGHRRAIFISFLVILSSTLVSSWTGSLNPGPGFYPQHVVSAGQARFHDRWFLFQVHDRTVARGWSLVRYRYQPQQNLASLSVWQMETLAALPKLQAALDWHAQKQLLRARPGNRSGYTYWPWLLLPVALETMSPDPVHYSILGWQIAISPFAAPLRLAPWEPMGVRYLRADFIDGSARWEFWFTASPQPRILRARQNGSLWWRNIHQW